MLTTDVAAATVSGHTAAVGAGGDGEEHPRPLFSLLIPGDYQGAPAFAVVRHFAGEDVARCRLCMACDAVDAGMDVVVPGRGVCRAFTCTKAARGTAPAARDSIELFSVDGLL